MKTHPKLVSFLTVLWLVTYTSLVYAAAELPSFAKDIHGFDFESLFLAAGAGLVGGAGRTIYSLATERVIVGNLWRETLKDAALALLGGIAIWVVVTVAASFFPEYINSGIRMLAIVVAGASRGKWALWLGGLIDVLLSAVKTRLVGWVSGNPQPPSDNAPSAVTPLETK